MGYLKTAGAPLRLPELRKVINYIKKHGIIQFCNIFGLYKDKKAVPSEALKWGDETEYHLLYFDHGAKRAKLLLNAKEFQDAFNETASKSLGPEKNLLLQPEYGAWMLEAIPKGPHDKIAIKDLVSLESYFKARVDSINNYLRQFGTIGISRVVAYPMMGMGDYATRFTKEELMNKFSTANPPVVPIEEEKHESTAEEAELLPLTTSANKYSQSIFTWDAAINPHPRFPTLTRNIRERRGNKVSIKIPLFIDEFTKIPSVPTEDCPYPGYIYMDSMQFGMGCCCLQLTFAARSINHARYLHDQLLALSPILSALSASSPIYRGHLADIDLRCTVISQGVDDRTEAERNFKNPAYVHKSRYSHNSHYISRHESIMPHHNDSPVFQVDPELCKMLHAAGVDERLAYHIASLFVRDPLVVYEKAIELDDTKTTAHFENLQSTNWNSIRFKPPPSIESDIGWRVEFRPMDIQITEYENACLTAIVALLVKLLTEFNVNFIVPMSMCDENMERAHKRNAILEQKFYFRKNVVPCKNYKGNMLKKTDFLKSCDKEPVQKEIVEEMTIEEILGGKEGYIGIFPLISELLEKEEGDTEKIKEYMEFLLGRAKGKYRTGAKYIRDFVRNHPEYKKDSMINERINYDLLCHLEELGKSTIPPREVYSRFPKQDQG
eukprot:TRINITY_DN371_c0_g1_i1.p2 TRINITY_DN371_c0_g1~~TRINITY_DN371_c0_g1_i1.p2  ORF type:complete len:665 (+),score=68.02 TRINITY_DN371_c0_g1_i1:8120-10114(+)